MTGTPRVAVVGGAGRVGLPLALTFAEVGYPTLILDIDRAALARIERGEMPFEEAGASALLRRTLRDEVLSTTTDPAALAACEFIVIIIGTPVDEHLNPTFGAIGRVIEECAPYLRDDQVLILRSTVYPGMSRFIEQQLRARGLQTGVAFCPERVAQGHSLREFRTLPQIVSAFDDVVRDRVQALFEPFTCEFIEMEPTEAELCKLMTNAWRYILFAITNQFYVIATEHRLDFERIYHGCTHNYARMAGMPRPGLAAGPCLVKDTMQLAAFSQNSFVLGHAAMLVNEGLPAHLIRLAKRETSLQGKVVGVLGMAFKADSDDTRDSLSYKLSKLLLLEVGQVLCTDPHVQDPTLTPLATLLERAEVLFVATPHAAYRGLVVPAGKVVVDIWSCLAPQPVVE